jgi:hypothetical protein
LFTTGKALPIPKAPAPFKISGLVVVPIDLPRSCDLIVHPRRKRQLMLIRLPRDENLKGDEARTKTAEKSFQNAVGVNSR